MQTALSVLETRLCGNPQQAACVERRQLVTFLNPYSYLIARKNIAVLSQFDTVCVDGLLLLLLLKACGFRIKQRISFDYTSIANAVLTAACAQHKSVFFVGSHDEAIKKFVAHIEDQYPNLLITGYSGGYFSSDTTRANTLNAIAKQRPDIVICGMGTPLQEQFLVDLSATGWAGTGYTCGGFIHQTASKNGLYFPHWINKLQLRFLFRLYKEPALWRRYVLEYPKIIPALLYDRLRYHRVPKS